MMGGRETDDAFQFAFIRTFFTLIANFSFTGTIDCFMDKIER